MFKTKRKWLDSSGREDSAPPRRRSWALTSSSGAAPLRPNSCFVIDSDPTFRRMVATAVASTGAVCTELESLAALTDRLSIYFPALIFTEVSLSDSDAIEAFRELSARKYRGVVQLVSGTCPQVLEKVHLAGLRHGLSMMEPLSKPCSSTTIRSVASEQLKRTQSASGTEGAVIDLDIALQNGWVEVWYQPKIDLKIRRVAGFEALSRVRHPDLGTVLPSEFLLHASRGCLRRLTEHVILTCMKEWPQLKGAGLSPKIAVNISSDCLSNVPVAKLMRDHRPQDASWPGLMFELSQSDAVDVMDGLNEIATQLLIYDAAFAIDDFGSGRMSFDALRSSLFSEIKLDSSYINDCSTSSQKAAICRSMIDLAHSFGAAVVAKGVENTDDLIELYKMNCDVAQGFLLARPMPMSELVPFLRLKAERQRQLTASGTPVPSATQLESRDRAASAGHIGGLESACGVD